MKVFDHPQETINASLASASTVQNTLQHLFCVLLMNNQVPFDNDLPWWATALTMDIFVQRWFRVVLR